MTTTKQTSYPGSSQSPKQTLPRPNPHTWDPPCNPSMPPFSHRVAPNTEHRPGAHPLEALADRPMWSDSVLSSADGVLETLRAAAGLRQPVSHLPAELIRSVPPVSHTTSPSSQSPNSRSNQHHPPISP
ncbi:hypothetical protein VE04_10243 [Pseudogymnoascus sp. 24MN13]|nr:hypothetical protein VE04_10243 [Pseudogymnoascus sp. 24MN13]